MMLACAFGQGDNHDSPALPGERSSEFADYNQNETIPLACLLWFDEKRERERLVPVCRVAGKYY